VGVRHRRLGLLLTLPLAALLVWTGAIAREAASQRPPTDAPRCRSGSARLGSAHVTVVAVVRTHARAYRRPGARPFARFRHLNQNGFPTVFRVLTALRGADCSARWYRVQLPIRPNGVTGYVRASAVETGRVRARVLVDLSAKRLTLFRSGKRILRTRVAVGSGDAHADRPLLRQPAADPVGSVRRVRPWGDRNLGPLDSLDRLDPGRADRDPRDERAVVDRARRLERVHPRA
jgi:hypothetical protein